MGNLLEELAAELKLNDDSPKFRAAFDAAYSEIVDEILKYLTADNEELPEELDTATIYEIYQREIKKIKQPEVSQQQKSKGGGKQVTKSKESALLVVKEEENFQQGDIGDTGRSGGQTDKGVGESDSAGGGKDTEPGQDGEGVRERIDVHLGQGGETGQ